jgi:hypothetical protein
MRLLQGFPDSHTFMSSPGSDELLQAAGEEGHSSAARSAAGSLAGAEGRRQQAALASLCTLVGNSVAPPVASALGRCLLAAVEGRCARGQAVLAVPDEGLLQVGNTDHHSHGSHSCMHCDIPCHSVQLTVGAVYPG